MSGQLHVVGALQSSLLHGGSLPCDVAPCMLDVKAPAFPRTSDVVANLSLSSWLLSSTVVFGLQAAMLAVENSLESMEALTDVCAQAALSWR